MTDKPVISPEACKEILEALGKEDLLYSHHANVHVRHFAYERMAELINNEMAAVYQYRKCEKNTIDSFFLRLKGQWLSLMGTKEEGYPILHRRGYAGQMYPLQVNVGPCAQCKLDVWIGPPSKPTGPFQSIKYYHHSCKPYTPKQKRR